MKPVSTFVPNEDASFLQKENKIFINSLTSICETFPKHRQEVSTQTEALTIIPQVKKTKHLLENDVLPDIEKLKSDLKQTNLRFDYNESKLTQFEAHMPLMIQEIFDYYFDKRAAESKENFVTHDQLKRSLSFKLDTVRFTDFLERHTAEQTFKDPIPPIKEQLHNIE